MVTQKLSKIRQLNFKATALQQIMLRLDKKELDVIIACLGNPPIPLCTGDKKRQIDKLISKLKNEKSIVNWPGSDGSYGPDGRPG